MISEEQQRTLASCFRVLGGETALLVAQTLAEARQPVSQHFIMEKLSDQGRVLSQPTISYSLNQMIRNGLAVVHKAGRYHLYSLDTKGLYNVLLFINNLAPEVTEHTELT
jgi:DNA-binding transcriptional ArsR family regulator